MNYKSKYVLDLSKKSAALGEAVTRPTGILSILLIIVLLFGTGTPFSVFASDTPPTVIFLTTPGSGTWDVPSDWNSSENTIEVIGGGGGGATSVTGGGGGAYALKNNVSLTPSTSVGIQVGEGGASGTDGTDSFLCNSTSGCANITDVAVQVGAKAGLTNGTAGDAAASIGDTKFSGGNGLGGPQSCGTPYSRGGGGAGGINGDGAQGTGGSGCDGGHGGGGGGGASGGTAGSPPAGTIAGGDGGDNFGGAGAGLGGPFNSDATAGTNGGGGGGAAGDGNGAPRTGGAGGAGTEWDAEHGSGGGGGAGPDESAAGLGGAGGLYGGGGGGSSGGAVAGAGAPGIIVITYVPSSPVLPLVPGHIKVDKVTNPSGDPTVFHFQTSGDGYIHFPLTDQGTPNIQELVPGEYSVSETETAGWDSDGGVCDNGQTPSSISLGAGGIVHCVFTNTREAGPPSNPPITITPLTAVNAVNAEHTFTVTLADAPDGTKPTIELASSNPLIAVPEIVSNECADTGTASEVCTVVIKSPAPGTFTIEATYGHHSATATKEYVGAQIALEPLDATNEVDEEHVITATIVINPGPAETLAPDGQLVTFTLINSDEATASFVDGIDTCTTSGGVGTCTVTINSSTAGTVTVNGLVSVDVSGVILVRDTDPATPTIPAGPNGTGPAVKTYVTDTSDDTDSDQPSDSGSSSSGSGGSGGSGGHSGFSFTNGGLVLGDSTSTTEGGEVAGASCGLSLDQYLKKDGPKNNPDQVTKLQQLLNKYGFGTFTPNGHFGPATLAAVKALQSTYAADILTPWHLSQPTGLVYLTTTRLLNLLECPALMLPMPTLVPWF